MSYISIVKDCWISKTGNRCAFKKSIKNVAVNISILLEKGSYISFYVVSIFSYHSFYVPLKHSVKIGGGLKPIPPFQGFSCHEWELKFVIQVHNLRNHFNTSLSYDLIIKCAWFNFLRVWYHYSTCLISNKNRLEQFLNVNEISRAKFSKQFVKLSLNNIKRM